MGSHCCYTRDIADKVARWLQQENGNDDGCRLCAQHVGHTNLRECSILRCRSRAGHFYLTELRFQGFGESNRLTHK
jgi:hypothetical protein